ncbi:MAG TPA: SGNH/GDSL hydrolase family protein [Amycolatopsis sp.]|uniref:SGNH/GDSL hydrolase family protein n=1 Tax=Amycolatopsis sp. TaxID=37632 RepID=UPI002B49F3D2|nr:SGNH/GDSL hydrolase family protein [Amycolatopsis sp.]HKS49671.1 SGNH/GDSL hydrolase family protein [Amycolatopsis sp.]
MGNGADSRRGRRLGLLLIVLVAAAGSVVAVFYLRPQQDSSAAPPAPPGSDIGGGTGRYVALGDSYTASPRTGAPVGDPPGCDRSDNNYPRLIAAELRPAEFADVSCSGATTANLTGPHQTNNGTNPPQLDAVNADTTLVTLGIGGNDVGFIGLARDCATNDRNVSPCRARLDTGGRDQLAERIDATAPKIADVLDRIRGKAPKARVIVVGYPTALPAGTGCWPFLPLGPDDVAYLRESAARFNRTLAAQAKSHQAGFADTTKPSKGHDMCTKASTKWVEDLVPSAPALSLHPNAKGERAMADAVLELLS